LDDGEGKGWGFELKMGYKVRGDRMGWGPGGVGLVDWKRYKNGSSDKVATKNINGDVISPFRFTIIRKKERIHI
jgi:hypothetical protein